MLELASAFVSGPLLGISERTLMWTKGGVLLFFLSIFLVVLVRVLTRTASDYADDALIVLRDQPVNSTSKNQGKPS